MQQDRRRSRRGADQFAELVLKLFRPVGTRLLVIDVAVNPIMQSLCAKLSQPFVESVGPGEGHWPILRQLLATCGTAGNLTSDAHLAALALKGGRAVYSTDNDFLRFPGIEVVNPLASAR